MDEGRAEGLLPWIAVPLVVFGLLLLFGLSLPSSDCNGEDVSGGAGEIVFIALAAVSILAVVGAGLFQLLEMAWLGRFRTADGLVLGGALLAVPVVATTVNRSGGSERFLIAGLVLAPVALLVLAVAALAGKRRASVGALLSVYLFGAAWWYYLVAAAGLAISDGAFC